MKKTLFILLVAASSFLSANARTIGLDNFINKYTKCENVEKICLGKSDPGTWLVNLPGKCKIESLNIYSLNSCSESDKNRFRNKLKRVRFKKYDIILKAKDSEDCIIIASKKLKKGFRSLVLLSCGNDLSIIKMKAKIRLKDIEETMLSLK